MNLDIHAMVNRIDHEMQATRLEQTRRTREAMGLRTGMTARLGLLLARAGARLQGIPTVTQPSAAVRAPESTHAGA